jgi:hypothetical protein
VFGLGDGDIEMGDADADANVVRKKAEAKAAKKTAVGAAQAMKKAEAKAQAKIKRKAEAAAAETKRKADAAAAKRTIVPNSDDTATDLDVSTRPTRITRARGDQPARTPLASANFFISFRFPKIGSHSPGSCASPLIIRHCSNLTVSSVSL